MPELLPLGKVLGCQTLLLLINAWIAKQTRGERKWGRGWGEAARPLWAVYGV